jgi:hypothetical protein
MRSTRGSARAERPGAATNVGAGILRVWGALLVVCFDEAFDKLVDVARLG